VHGSGVIRPRPDADPMRGARASGVADTENRSTLKSSSGAIVAPAAS
jgi:hypothetical protein